ncbi:MAG: photosynthetic complex assembly protein PuhC [Pseudomonadota bacterium]
MSHHHNSPPSEKFALMGAAALVILAVGVVAVSRLTGAGQLLPQNYQSADTIELVFLDAEDGSVRIEDAQTGELLSSFSEGEAGFARNALRGLFYSRQVHGIRPDAPISLGHSDNGLLILSDSFTNQTITLDAFGDSNAEQFLALLEPGENTQ